MFVARVLSDQFGTEVSIEIIAAHDLQGQALYDAMEQHRQKLIAVLPTVSEPQ